MRTRTTPLIAGLVLAALSAGSALAETVKVAVGQRGNWDTSVAQLGQQVGIFKKHGLDLEILYTQGGGETQQVVISRGAQIGVAAGTLGALGAAARGAPVRIIGNETTGAADLFWYVPVDSKIRTVADLAGKTVSYSTNGSSTHTVVLMQQGQGKVDLKPVATGGLPSTYTQVMSGQIDVGWSAAPFGVDQLDQKIRIVFRGSDLPDTRDQTIRVLITHAAELAQNGPMIERFLAAYRETLDWMYESPDAIPTYAKFAGVSETVAKRTRDEFFPKQALAVDRISGLDKLMADGVGFKFLTAPLTPEQLKQVVQVKGGPK